MESFRGLSDEELLEKLQSRRGPLGPPRKLYEKKFYEFETRRWRRGGADDPDSDRAPPEFGGGARARQPIVERSPSPSPTLMDHVDSPLRLEPRQPLRAPPGPPKIFAGPPEPPPGPGRLLPPPSPTGGTGGDRGGPAGAAAAGGGPWLRPPKSCRDPPPPKKKPHSESLGTPPKSTPKTLRMLKFSPKSTSGPPKTPKIPLEPPRDPQNSLWEPPGPPKSLWDPPKTPNHPLETPQKLPWNTRRTPKAPRDPQDPSRRPPKFGGFRPPPINALNESRAINQSMLWAGQTVRAGQ